MGRVTVDNTENRKAEILASIKHVLEVGRLHRHDSFKLGGRLQFFAGQIFCRIAKRGLEIVTKHAYGDHSPELGLEATQALQLFCQLIAIDVPRELSSRTSATWYVPQIATYTAGIGAVLVDAMGRRCGFVSTFLSDALISKLNVTKKKKKTIVFECELLAMYVAMRLWAKQLTDSQVVVCTDN